MVGEDGAGEGGLLEECWRFDTEDEVELPEGELLLDDTPFDLTELGESDSFVETLILLREDDSFMAGTDSFVGLESECLEFDLMEDFGEREDAFLEDLRDEEEASLGSDLESLRTSVEDLESIGSVGLETKEVA